MSPQGEALDEGWWYFHGALPSPGDEIEIKREAGDATRARVIGVVDPYGLEAGAVITATPLTEAPSTSQHRPAPPERRSRMAAAVVAELASDARNCVPGV